MLLLASSSLDCPILQCSPFSDLVISVNPRNQLPTGFKSSNTNYYGCRTLIENLEKNIEERERERIKDRTELERGEKEID